MAVFNGAIFNNAVFNTPVTATQPDGGSRRFRPYKLHPEEIEREQRMVQEYLRTLEEKPVPENRPARVVAKERKAELAKPVIPQLTREMAAAATFEQLRAVLESKRAAELDRVRARDEHRRRYVQSFTKLMLLH